MMKKNLAVLCVLGCFTSAAWAGNTIDPLKFTGANAQANFKIFSEDLGAALSYKAVTPPAPLGIAGFDLGLEITSTKMRNLKTATSGSSDSLPVPKLHVYKGLPMNFDIGAVYSAVPSSNVKYYGGELRYAIMEGGMALPAVGVRGAITKLSGVNQLSLSTKSLDVSVSKGFLMFSPYAGAGVVWTDSTPDAALGLTKESFQQTKVFIGGNLNLGLTNLALEMDKTGSANSVSAKIGFRF
jgi:hypothetical protein